MDKKSNICNCYHSKEDHVRMINLNPKATRKRIIGWCRYSEYGQCPCDVFTEISNLEFLEYKHGMGGY